MINVFIDTSIFVSEGYVKGKSIATLFEAAWEEKINILKGSGGQELLYTLSAQYIDLWSSSSLQGIARASSDSALASFVTSLKNRYPCVA